MGTFLWVLAVFGVGYIVGFVSRELQVLLYYTVTSMKARREAASNLAYDKIMEAAERRESEDLPDKEAVSKDEPEQEDIDEEEKKKGIKTFWS